MFSVRWALVGGAIVGSAVGAFLIGSSSSGQNAPPPTAPPKEVVSYRDVVKRVLPGVVSIEAKTSKPMVDPNRRDAKPDDGLGFGSGWIYDPRGVVITNYHVVDGADHFEITLTDGRKFPTKDVLVDKKTDLAILRFTTTEKLPVLAFGDSDAMEMGDRVFAFGAPFGLAGSVTSGIVSAKGRNLRLNMYEDFIQTDAAINPGSSGGPLVNMNGQVIGITSAIKSRTGGFTGVGLAISSNFAKSVVQQLLKDQVVKRGFLGIEITDLRPEIAARVGLPNGAVSVKRVFPDTPASRAGIKVGDMIATVSGKPVKDGRELQRLVEMSPLTAPLEVTIRREGKMMKVAITLAEKPDGSRP